MRIIAALFTVATLVSPVVHGQDTTTFVGVVTDTMCGASHVSMGVAPESKCVRECVGDGATYKYGLAVGKAIYTLSDQETPAKFAGRRVKVTGVLYTKTNILKVDTMTAAN